MTNSLAVSNYASLNRRLLAWVIDLMILALPCAIAARLIPILGGIAVLFLYAPILESSEIRATIGKHLLGIQVTDLAGRRLSFRAALIRNALKFVSTALLFIGFVFALFSQKKQTLHDLLADSLVIYGRSERSISNEWMTSLRQLFKQDRITQLERLQKLRDNGILSEEEFQREKQKILAS